MSPQAELDKPLPEHSGPLRSDDVDAAAWLFEQLLIAGDQPADRARVRRAVAEAAMAFGPAEDQGSSFKWLVEASHSLGLKSVLVEGTVEQILKMAVDGAQILSRDGSNDGWVAIQSARRSRYQVAHTPQRRRAWLDNAETTQLLQTDAGDGAITCLVLQAGSVEALGGHHDHHAGHRDPLEMLWALLRPERGDIWVIVVFALVTGMLALATPLAVETLVNNVAFGRLLQPVVVLAIILLAFLSFSASLRALQTYVVEIIQRRLFARVVADLAYRLPRVDLPSVDGQSGRELVNRFFDVVTVQKVSAQLLLDGISIVLGALIGMAVLAFYHPWLLGFDIALLASIAFVIMVLGRGAVASSIQESKTKYRMAAWLEDLMSCPLAFRQGSASEFALNRADHLTHDYLTARRSHFHVLMRQIIFALGTQALASTVLLGLGGWLVISGQLTLGQLVAAELIVTVIVGAFAKLGKHMESYYDLLAAVDKLGVLLQLPIEQQDGLLTLPGSGGVAVTLSGISFGTVHRFAAPIDLHIASGERAMITGPSGSGKSRLLDVMFATRAPEGGHILVDGIDPRDLRPDALRRHVALIREVEIFSGTVAENIHLERDEVSVNEVRDALAGVGLLDAVLRLPAGLHTQLTPEGYPLSSNQARRLMLARAVAGRPRLLLIDGLIDALPDDDAERLTAWLVDRNQPWTLVMVTGRRQLAAAGTTTFALGAGHRFLIEDKSHDV